MQNSKLQNKKLLILGSDFGVLDLVKTAQNLGVYTIVCDLMQTSPAKQAADEAWLLSTTELDELEQRIQTHHIDGVLAGASEFNLDKVRALCKRLGLPVYCASDTAWEIARNKRMFKDLCIKHQVPVATDYVMNDQTQDDVLSTVVYPVVVKPVDSSGNRGQSFCYNESELKAGIAHARENSRQQTVIVEHMLKGEEFSAYYAFAQGESVFLFFTADHHDSSQKANIYSIKTTTASHVQNYLKEVDEHIRDVFQEAGMQEGVAFVDCMRDVDGHFYVLEIGYRLGGPVIYPMFERIAGFSAYEWLIETALGVEHTPEDLPTELIAYRPVALSYNLFTHRAGTIARIEGLDSIEARDDMLIDMPKREGAQVRDHANMGVIRMIAPNMDKACELIAFVNEHLKIYDETGEPLYIAFTDFDQLKDQYEQGLRAFDF